MKCLLVCFCCLFVISLSSNISAEIIYTWQDCLEEAKANHPDLISAREGINQSKADKDIIASDLFPQVDSDLGVASSKNSSSDRSEKYTYGLTGSQLLFDGFKTTHQVKEAKQQIIASQFSYMVVSSNVRLRLRNAFVDLLKEEKLLNITNEIVKRRQENFELVKLRYEAGREHKGALLLAEANLAQAQANVSQARRNVNVAQRRLNKELGWTQFISINVQGNFEVTDFKPQQPDFEELVQMTPFLKELMARREASKYGLSSAKSEYFPQIFVNADIGRSESRWPPRDKSSSAGVKVTLPLFDGGNRRSSVQRAQSVAVQAQADERSGRDGMIFTLHGTWALLQDAVDNVTVQKKFLESAKARAKISEAQYANGLISFDDWIIIEDALVRAKTNFLENQANALLAEANWIQARGGTLENEN